MLEMLLYLLALVLFGVAAFGGSIGKLNLVAAGLAVWLFAEHLLNPFLGMLK